MDLLYIAQSTDTLTSHSDSELSNMDDIEVNSSLPRHSHFFCPPSTRVRPRSVPLLVVDNDDPCAASPMLTVLDDFTSERLERDSVEETDKDGIRFENRASLAHDLQFLANMPELCDTTFLVGEERQPICGVKGILAARSRVFRRLLFNDSRRMGKKKVSTAKPPDGYIERYDLKGNPVIIVTDFEPNVFKLLIDYIHTGSVMLQARSLLGLMNAADHYGLEDLKLACIRFMEHCISVDTVCSLLASAEKYIQYKSTKILVQKMFEFVDRSAEKILSLGAFQQLPQHVVRIVLGREELQAQEITKFQAAYRWTLRYVDDHQELTLMEGFEPFVDVIDFTAISAKDLMQNVRKAEVVEDKVILNALAAQADPSSAAMRGRSGQKLRKAATVPSDIEVQTKSPSPPEERREQKEMRRSQSSKQCLPYSTEVNGTSSPDGRWQHGASVPSLDMVGTGTKLRQNGTKTTPTSLQDSRSHDDVLTTRSSSSGSLQSPPADIDSNHDDSNHGSLSSLGAEGDTPLLTSSPLALNRQRHFLAYNPLDMIVTASNPDNTPVNV